MLAEEQNQRKILYRFHCQAVVSIFSEQETAFRFRTFLPLFVRNFGCVGGGRVVEAGDCDQVPSVVRALVTVAGP